MVQRAQELAAMQSSDRIIGLIVIVFIAGGLLGACLWGAYAAHRDRETALERWQRQRNELNPERWQ